MPVQRAEGYWNLGLDFLDSGNYIAANRSLIKAFGLNLAVIIGELASEARYWKREGKLQDGWFFSTVENIEKATGINGYYQRDAIKQLQALGFIEIKYKDAPRKRYFRINGMNIIQTIAQIEEEEETAGERQCFTQCTINDAPSAPLMVHPVDDNNNKEQQQPTKKKERRKPVETFDSIIAERTDNPELVEAIGEFIRMRSRIKKPLTNYALKLRLKTLWKLGKTDEERIAIVEQSVGACWQDFYELKSDVNARKPQRQLDLSAYATKERPGSMRIEDGTTYVMQQDGTWQAQEDGGDGDWYDGI